MILFLHVHLFIYLFIFIFLLFLSKSSNNYFWCDNLYRIHNICKYFEFVGVHIQKYSKNKCLVKVKDYAVCLLG